jgi:hypothetical protein
MLGQQAQQLDAGVSGSAHYPNLDHPILLDTGGQS